MRASLLALSLLALAAGPAAAQPYLLPPPGQPLPPASGPTSDWRRSGDRIDFFDTKSRRSGYGEFNRYGDGKIDFYNSKGRRTGTGQVSPGSGRR